MPADQSNGFVKQRHGFPSLGPVLGGQSHALKNKNMASQTDAVVLETIVMARQTTTMVCRNKVMVCQNVILF
jgi:hypothetical protein